MRPAATRRDANLPEDKQEAPGIRRNPGVSLIWVSRNWKPFRDSNANGWLINVGDPVQTLWYREGRGATHDEIVASITSGLPALQEMADKEGNGAPEALEKQLDEAMELVPA